MEHTYILYCEHLLGEQTTLELASLVIQALNNSNATAKRIVKFGPRFTKNHHASKNAYKGRLLFYDLFSNLDHLPTSVRKHNTLYSSFDVVIKNNTQTVGEIVNNFISYYLQRQ